MTEGKDKSSLEIIKGSEQQMTPKEIEAVKQVAIRHVLRGLSGVRGGWVAKCRIAQISGPTPDAVLEKVLKDRGDEKAKRYSFLADVAVVLSHELRDDLLPATNFQQHAIEARRDFDNDAVRKESGRELEEAKRKLREAKTAYKVAVEGPRKAYTERLIKTARRFLEKSYIGKGLNAIPKGKP